MAFFDKINELAKNVGDKTKEAMEISKLTTKIRTEKTAIDAAYKKLGAYFYEKHTAGEVMDETAEEILAAIDASNAAIAELEAEIAKIKEEKEAAAKAPEQPVTSGITCPNCGTQNSPDTKFCGNCGAKVEVPAPPSGNACPNCGIQNPEGTKFCGGCGNKMEPVQNEVQEPAKKFCPSCGIEVSQNTKFCGNCGTKIE